MKKKYHLSIKCNLTGGSMSEIVTMTEQELDDYCMILFNKSKKVIGIFEI